MTNHDHRCLQPVLVALSLLAVCSVANAADNIVDVADKAGKFKTLLAAAEAAGLAEVLQGDGPFTVFAPTDDAFAKISPNLLKLLLTERNCKGTLAKILQYHIISGEVSAKDAAQLHSPQTVVGAQVEISIRDGRLAINNANVVATDVKASNGIIHVIDKVLMPERFTPNGRVLVFPAQGNIVDTAAAAGNLKTLITAVKAARLADTLQGEGPFTLLAPSDEAFAKLPHGTIESLLKPENKHKLAAILKYHVLPKRQTAQEFAHWGSTTAIDGNLIDISSKHPLTFNDCKVVAADIVAGNGIIHVIDQVLMPPAEGPQFFKRDSDFRLLQRLDPELESTLRSSTHSNPTTVTFCNLSSRPIQVYWVDSHGKRKKWRGLIQPGTLELCERSFTGHVWLIADEHGEGLGLYVLDKQDGLVAYKTSGGPLPKPPPKVVGSIRNEVSTRNHDHHGVLRSANDSMKPLEQPLTAALEAIGGSAKVVEGRVVSISFSGKQLKDDDFAILAEFPDVADLNLYKSSIGDAGLVHLKGLTKLRSLAMGSTNVTDAGLVHLRDMTQLTYVGLRANNITDTGLVHLRKLINLEGLCLAETEVTDAGLSNIQHLTNMDRLYLFTTNVSDAGLIYLKEMANLEYISVYETDITESGVRTLREWFPNCNVDTEE